MQFARDVVGLLRQSVNIHKLEDPSTVTLRGLRLDNLPLWVARMLLTEKRLRDVKHVVATDCSGITDALVELLVGEALGVGGMGSIHRHHLGMLGREPGPHLIHPSPSVGMAMGG